MIYVTELERDRQDYGWSCRLISDKDSSELAIFALGLKIKPTAVRYNSVIPYIKLSPYKRDEAVRKGVKQINRAQYINMVQFFNNKPLQAEAV